MNLGDYAKKAVSFLARNFYTLKYVALVLAFCINFVLLFYKVMLKHSSMLYDEICVCVLKASSALGEEGEGDEGAAEEAAEKVAEAVEGSGLADTIVEAVENAANDIINATQVNSWNSEHK